MTTQTQLLEEKVQQLQRGFEKKQHYVRRIPKIAVVLLIIVALITIFFGFFPYGLVALICVGFFLGVTLYISFMHRSMAQDALAAAEEELKKISKIL